MDTHQYHIPVMLQEVLNNMQITSGARVLDGTFGEGGHTLALLAAGAEHVVSLDRDREALERFRLARDVPDPLELHHLRFSEVDAHFPEASFDAALVDLGPSTRQLLSPERGFSFRNSGVSDFRMDRDRDLDLRACLSMSSPEALGEFLQRQVGVKGGRRLAHKVFELFDEQDEVTTEQIAALLPRRGPGKNPATELFLGLRMWVNDELGEVERGIPALVRVLKPGGRLVVLTFHSTEDRLVKRIFNSLAGVPEEGAPIELAPPAVVRKITRRPISPTEKEISDNPRARSTKLRCVEKIGHA